MNNQLQLTIVVMVCLLSFTHIADLAVRLVRGEGAHEGEVQVFYNGTWGYICNENQYWDNDEAKAVCRELGYISETG